MKKHWIATVGLVALLTACSSVTPAAPGAGAPALDGTAWVVTAIGGSATLPDHQPTIAFAVDRAPGWLAATNSARDSHRRERNSWTRRKRSSGTWQLSAILAEAATASPVPGKSAVLTALEAASSYTILVNTLTLKADDGTGLEFRAA